MHEVLVNRLGGLSLPRKSVVRLTDRPDMTLDVYRGRKTTIQYNSAKKVGGVTVLISARRLVMLYISTKFCEMISNGIKVIERTRFLY